MKKPRLAILISAVIIIACTCVTNTPISFPFLKPTVTSTPMPIPTSMLTLTPTPTSTPTIKPTTVPVVLYSDDFSNNQSGWEQFSSTEEYYQYSGGQYVISRPAGNNINWALAYRSFSDAVLTVDAILVSGSGNAIGPVIMWRYVDDKNFYSLQLTPGDGQYHVAKVFQGEWQNIIDWAFSSAINRGNQINKITIDFSGGTSAIYINDKYVTSIQDSSFTTGDICLGAASSVESAVEVSFDNLVIYSNEAEADDSNTIPNNPCESLGNKYEYDTDLGEIKTDYVGSWHAAASVGSGYNERFVFFSSGNYLFFPSQYECNIDDASCKPSPIEEGTWGVQDGQINLAKEGDISKVRSILIGKVIDSPPDESPYSLKTTFDGTTYWLMSKDTNMWNPETGELCD